MTKLDKIEQAVEALDAEDLARFRAWFANYDAAQWDAGIEADATAGRLDRLMNAALAEHRSGATRRL